MSSLLRRNDDIVEVERQSCKVRHTITKVLDTVEERAGPCHTYRLDNVGDKATERFLRDDTVEVANLVRDNLVDDDTSDRGLDEMFLYLSVDKVLNDDLHRGVEVATAFVVSYDSLLRTVEGKPLTLGSGRSLVM